MNKELIKQFIKEINPKIKVKFQKWVLEVAIPDKTIYVGKDIDNRTNEIFMEYAKTIDKNIINVNYDLLSILHEIGHIETYNKINNFTQQVQKVELNQKYNNFNAATASYEELKQMFFEYFNFALERPATEWAINFALTHKDLLKKYQNIKINA